jgi:hypothetical protein
MQFGPLPGSYSVTARGPWQPSRRIAFRHAPDLVIHNDFFDQFGGCIETVRTGHRFSWTSPAAHTRRGRVVGPIHWYDPDHNAGQLPHVDQLGEMPPSWQQAIREHDATRRPSSSATAREGLAPGEPTIIEPGHADAVVAKLAAQLHDTRPAGARFRNIASDWPVPSPAARSPAAAPANPRWTRSSRCSLSTRSGSRWTTTTSAGRTRASTEAGPNPGGSAPRACPKQDLPTARRPRRRTRRPQLGKPAAPLGPPRPLICDDFAMRELSMTHADDLYELITERAGRPVIFTSDRTPTDWYPLFPNPVVAESILDRVVNTAHHIAMPGRSYRPRRRPTTTDASAR